MPPPTRPRIAPTDDWHQLELLARDPVQRTYELIRPVVLFGRSPAERARESGAAERTLRRQADRFDAHGMAALLPPSEEERRRRVPAEVRQAILALKAEHPPLGPYEIAGIVGVRFDYPVSYHTVQRLLAEAAPPPAARRRFAPFHEIADPAGRRLADRLFGGMKDRKLDYENIATVLFTHPPIGTIGLSEEAAVKAYGDKEVRVYEARFTPMAYAFTRRKVQCSIKLVVTGTDERIVGCHIIGAGADEIMQGFAVAMRMGATKRDFDDTVAIHPTVAEELVTLRTSRAAAPAH